jgi:hypothetical protein
MLEINWMQMMNYAILLVVVLINVAIAFEMERS